MSDEYWLTLPSNSSTDVFPQNTLQNYTTKLSEPLNLTEDYEVALAQIIFPNNFSQETITDDTDTILLQVYKINRDKSLEHIVNFEYELRCTQRDSKYSSLKQLVGEINKEIQIYRSEPIVDVSMRAVTDLPAILYNQTYKSYSVANEITRTHYVRLVLKTGIARRLGFTA